MGDNLLGLINVGVRNDRYWPTDVTGNCILSQRPKSHLEK